MNITIIAAIFISFFHRMVGVRRGIFLAGLGIAIYTLLVGADAAVIRAAINPNILWDGGGLHYCCQY